MDDCFLWEACGVCEDDEETTDPVDGKREMPILVAYDDVKGAFWTLKVRAKGPTESVVKWCCSRLEDPGCAGSEVTVKTDQGESIIALRTAIAAARVGDTIPIHSAVRCSKSNGRMDGSIRIWQRQLGTLTHDFEFQLFKRQFLSKSAMCSWLVVWAAGDIHKFKVQQDGRTAYEAITKHKCTHLIVGFGELIHWQMAPAKPKTSLMVIGVTDSFFE